MNTLLLIKNYGDKIDPSILTQYKKHDKFLWVNEEDKDMEPVRIDLPTPPPYDQIKGFGLPSKKQRFVPIKLPRRIKDLQKRFETIDEIYAEMQKSMDLYEEEIEFMEIEWHRRLYGFWFFNNGKPTYIDGWHYFYITWWKIDSGLPEYRSRDRKFFLFARMCYTETKTFANIDEKGRALKEEDEDDYQLRDTNRRVFYGFNYPKHRREGATYKAECINYEIISRTLGAWGGIQSMNEAQGKKCFLKHLVAPWKKLPFFFKPNYEGSTSPKTELSFSPPAQRLSSRGSKVTSDIGLESMVNFSPADEGAYDGDKLYFHHDDEIGKLKKGVSCWKRHMVVKECLGMGSEIIGFTIKTSTVGEMERGGGKEFKHQCSMSNYHVRTKNGQTVSGLINLFIPAYDGLQGFIDQYGDSIIDTPTKEQAEYIGDTIGAREYLLNKRKGYIDAADSEGLSEQIRLYPMSFTECFRTAAKSSGFNMQKLEQYIDDLRFNKKKYPIEGDFEWAAGKKDGLVRFVSKKGGKFKISHQLTDEESNRKWRNEDLERYEPGNTAYGIAGADPYKFNKTEGYRKSDGAGAVVRKGAWSVGRMSVKRKFVCTYTNRPHDKYIYAEDMLMMCVYYGVKMFPETNVPLIWDYFEDRGYGGYLLYSIDPITMMENKKPGGYTDEKLKQALFSEYMQYIEHEADEETHLELLEECRDIAGPEDMTNFDLFTAGGFALLGTADIYDKAEEIEKEEVDYSKFFRKRVYSS